MKVGLLGLFCLIIRKVTSVVLIYKTREQDLVQSYDCIYYGGDDTLTFTQSVEYCIRPENYIQLKRNYSQGCQNNGLLFTFDQLQRLNVSYDQLLSWSSGVDAVDRYQTYLNRR
jgi:hypothetical protein